MPRSTSGNAEAALQFNVAQLLKQPTGARREYEILIESPHIEDAPGLVTPLCGRVQFVRVGDGILVTGSITTTVRSACSRCLGELDRDVAIDIEEEYQPVLNILTGSPVPIGEDQDSANLIDEHHVLDLTEVVRQDLWTSLPPSLLCREDCQGLCPQCGQNLNEGICSCSTEEIDARWVVLLQDSSGATE